MIFVIIGFTLYINIHTYYIEYQQYNVFLGNEMLILLAFN
jgi:hypothetical protein